MPDRAAPDAPQADAVGAPSGADGAGAGDEGGEGRLAASRRTLDSRRDLRALSDPADFAQAARVAERLARAIRDRRSRRRRAANRGAAFDLRRMLRPSLPRGGEPIELMRRRPDRPMRIVCLLDVSGSMEVYARVFLAFARGLTGADPATRVWLFHTRLIDATPRCATATACAPPTG